MEESEGEESLVIQSISIRDPSDMSKDLRRDGAREKNNEYSTCDFIMSQLTPRILRFS